MTIPEVEKFHLRRDRRVSPPNPMRMGLGETTSNLDVWSIKGPEVSLLMSKASLYWDGGDAVIQIGVLWEGGAVHPSGEKAGPK